jgi:hypothetical protein
MAKTVTASDTVTTNKLEADDATLTRLIIPGTDGFGKATQAILQYSDLQSLLEIIKNKEVIQWLNANYTALKVLLNPMGS